MGQKLEQGEVYRGPCGVLKDSNWLSAETIPHDRDTVVTIEAVVRRREVKFKDETKVGYGSLRFAGKDKELGLNATLILTLRTMFGPNTGDWFGKQVALYVDPDVKAFGRIVPAVRIRSKVPAASAPTGAAATSANSAASATEPTKEPKK
jgi:hypothetical protein